MKQKAKLFIIAACIAVLAVIGYFVYGNTVTTDYYSIQVSPAMSSILYGERMKPNVDIKRIGSFDSDTAAINAQTREVVRTQKANAAYLEILADNLKGADFRRAKNKEEIAIVISSLQSENTLVAIKHRRGYTPDDAIVLLKKEGLKSSAWESFCQKNKLEVSVYPIEGDDIMVMKALFTIR